jgi:hypothetical protein
MTLKARPISELTPKDGPVLIYWSDTATPILFDDAEWIHAQIASGTMAPMYWAPLPKLEVEPPPTPAPKMYCWVRYHASTKITCPAVITEIDSKGMVCLTIFPPANYDGSVKREYIRNGYGTAPGQWSYPEETA